MNLMVQRLTKETSTDEKSVVNSHSNDLPYKFAVYVEETSRQAFLRCIGYLSFIKDRIKARFIANSSSCTDYRTFKITNFLPHCYQS